MTDEQHALIIKLRDKIRKLIEKFEKEQDEKQLLKVEIIELKEKLTVKEEEYKALDKKYNTLKLARAFSDDNGESHDAKVKVNKIVREIDKCIALLNK